MKGQSLRLALFFLLLIGNGCYKNELVPAADFSFSGSNEFQSPCVVIFENKSVNAFSFQWEFGDDSSSYSKEPVHVFMKAGNFDVKLRAYSESGKEWASIGKQIRIKQSPGLKK
jgi:PKD repeat protein